jgi:hypothetical protein
MVSWKEILLGSAKGLQQLSSIDTEDVRSACIKRAVGTMLHLNGNDQALQNAFHRGGTVLEWDVIRVPIEPALGHLCESLIDRHRLVTRQMESVVMRTFHLEHDVLVKVANEHAEQEVNEFIRRLVVGLTDPVFCYARANHT